MYDWLRRMTNFLIHMALAAVLAGAILAALVAAGLLLRYAAHLF